MVPMVRNPVSGPAETTGVASDKPYPSTIIAPVLPFEFSCTGPCSGPAPEMAARSFFLMG